MLQKPMDANQLFFNFQIQDYYEYIQLMEESISFHKQTVEERFKKEVEDITDEQSKQLIYEFRYFDDYKNLDETYTLILRKSTFISLHSFFESELNKIAKLLEQKNVSKIKLSDLKHQGIQKYLFYIETVHEINIQLTEKERKSFKDYTDLRNYFVHNDGISISQNKHRNLKSIYYLHFEEQYCQSENSYTVKTLEKEFNETYLDLISIFFEKLFTALQRKHAI